jgi:hypothetical protein
MSSTDKVDKSFLQYAKASLKHRRRIDATDKGIEQHMEMLYLWGDQFLADKWPVEAFWPTGA